MTTDTMCTRMIMTTLRQLSPMCCLAFECAYRLSVLAD